MSTVVIVNGYPRCGKDTFVDLCKEAYPGYIESFSTVGPVKEAAVALGWDGTKSDDNRSFLHELKMLWTKYFDGSFNYINSMVSKYDNHVVFVMAREIPEIARFKKHFGDKCVTLLIERDGLHKPDNYADANVEGIEGVDFQYDVKIKNINGDDWLEVLENNVDWFLKNHTDVDSIMALELAEGNIVEFDSKIDTVDSIKDFLDELEADRERFLITVEVKRSVSTSE